MPSVDKLIEKMRNQPNGISYDEAAKVLEGKGYHFNRQNGSHCHFRAKSGDVITVARHEPLKRAYVEEILERIGEK
jgi:predicted RNA binding protein YcfA (HicA-like mRNA interferase family)